MRVSGLKLLLLATFAFWATGAARFAHEIIEHHGGAAADVAGIDGCDDDDCGGAVVTTDASAPSPAHHGHPCPVCQMLAAMAVSPPPVVTVPALSLDVVGTRVIADRTPPLVRPEFDHPATGPPTAAVAGA